jgi:hypothetical protein
LRLIACQKSIFSTWQMFAKLILPGGFSARQKLFLPGRFFPQTGKNLPTLLNGSPGGMRPSTVHRMLQGQAALGS